MKTCLSLALACAVVVGWAAERVEARGGGARGGARPSGARPSGNFNRGSSFGGATRFNEGPARDGVGNSQFGRPSSMFGQKVTSSAAGSRVGAAQNKASQLQANFSSKNEPFSAAWYADHPNAWRYTHPHADAWAVATAGGLWGWLGWGAYYPATEEDGNYYTSDTSDDGASQTADDTGTADDAAALAARGAVDVPSDTEFLPLGVYAIAPANQQEATALVQLSASKDGILRGSYCDLVSDQGQTVFGAIDKKSQRVAWTVGDGGRVVFDTMLANLTQAEGPVALVFPNGSTRQYTLARFEEQTPSQQ